MVVDLIMENTIYAWSLELIPWGAKNSCILMVSNTCGSLCRVSETILIEQHVKPLLLQFLSSYKDATIVLCTVVDLKVIFHN